LFFLDQFSILSSSLPLRNNNVHNFVIGLAYFLFAEIEQIWDLAFLNLEILVSQILEVRMSQSFHRFQSSSRVVDKNLRNQINYQGVSISQDLAPILSLDLWEFKFVRFGVHLENLFRGWGSQNLNNFNKLIKSWLSREDRLTNQHFSYDTAHWPNINSKIIKCSAKDKFRSSIVSWTDVGDVWFIWIEFLGWSKITQLKKVGAGIYQQVLWLNISVTNTERMNISQRSEHLIRIQFNQNIRNSLFSFSVISHNLVEGFRNEIHNNIQKYFILLFALSIESVSQHCNVRMFQLLKNLQFSIFISFILEDFLNCNSFASFSKSCLKYNTKRSISNDSLSVIGLFFISCCGSVRLI